MRRPLAGDDAIVATCVGRQNGAVVKSKSERDSVCAVFAMIADATAAATGPRRYRCAEKPAFILRTVAGIAQG
jgi:hypothetical protein